MPLGRNRWRLFPGILAAVFAGTMAASVVLTAVLLDVFLIRFDRGSVTTMLPGFVYATALILKIGLLEAAVLGAIAFLSIAGRRTSENVGVDRTPVWAIVSVILPAVAPLAGTLVILITQGIVEKPGADTVIYFTRISQVGVFAVIGTVALACASAVVAFLRRERPHWFWAIGFLTSALQLVLFVYWEFYKLGFDQDRWNDI